MHIVTLLFIIICLAVVLVLVLGVRSFLVLVLGGQVLVLVGYWFLGVRSLLTSLIKIA